MKTPVGLLTLMKESPKEHFITARKETPMPADDIFYDKFQMDTTCVENFELQTICETNEDCLGAAPGCVHCAYYEVNGQIVEDEERICINTEYCDYDFSSWNLYEEGD